MHFRKRTTVRELLAWLKETKLAGLSDQSQALLMTGILRHLQKTAFPMFTEESVGLEALRAMYCALFPPAVACKMKPGDILYPIAEFLNQQIIILTEESWEHRS